MGQEDRRTSGQEQEVLEGLSEQPGPSQACLLNQQEEGQGSLSATDGQER